MNKFFIDSNICIYAFDKSDSTKQQKAFELLEAFPFISSQVVIEIYNACSKKLKLPVEVCEQNTLYLCDIAYVTTINDAVIRSAILFKRKYQFSFLDALIVASAYCNGCNIVYSEDMHHGLVVEKQLTIINPFV